MYALVTSPKTRNQDIFYEVLLNYWSCNLCLGVLIIAGMKVSPIKYQATPFSSVQKYSSSTKFFLSVITVFFSLSSPLPLFLRHLLLLLLLLLVLLRFLLLLILLLSLILLLPLLLLEHRWKEQWKIIVRVNINMFGNTHRASKTRIT